MTSTWLLYGGNGWIGTQVAKLLQDDLKKKVHISKLRIHNSNIKEIENEIKEYNNIMCFVGRTHGKDCNTIDYLEGEGKLVENLNDNLYSPMVLAILCHKHKKHLTYMGTGCIFSYNENTPKDGYNEESLPDFFGSSYSIVKGYTDTLMHMYEDTVLNVRIRMPIVDYDCSRNFITKIASYDKVVNIPNSMTVLPELLPIMIDLATNKFTGTINLTNPGVLSHNQVLEMYKKYVDPEFKWDNLSVLEQNKILKSKRSNNTLDTTKLQLLYPQVKSISNSVEALLKNYN
jgi:3,5-epimerase/4-reductase